MFTADDKLEGLSGIAGADEDVAADVGCVADCVELAVDIPVDVARALWICISNGIHCCFQRWAQPVFAPVIPPRSHGFGGDTAAIIANYTPGLCMCPREITANLCRLSLCVRRMRLISRRTDWKSEACDVAENAECDHGRNLRFVCRLN